MRAFVLRLGSAAPVRGSINVSNNKPRAYALGYAGVLPLQGFSTSSHMLYYFDAFALSINNKPRACALGYAGVPP